MVGAHKPTAPRASPRSPENQRDDAWIHEEAIRLKQYGLRLLEATNDQAVHDARRIAAALETQLVVEHSAESTSAGDPAEAMRLALRDAVVFEMRRIARVISGRITRMETPGRTAAQAVPTPPARLELDLETQEDRRTIQLEDAWAWSLHASGAQEGDVVQVDRDHPLVTVRPTAELPEGRVIDERDHRVQIPLGALDRAHAASSDGTDEEDPDQAVLYRAARSNARMLATGERSPTGTRARATTDAWVRRRLSERHTRLIPGVLLILEATGLPERAAAALRASRTAIVAPWVLLNEDEGDRMLELSHRWREPQEPAD